jgi:hypothetical protein
LADQETARGQQDHTYDQRPRNDLGPSLLAIFLLATRLLPVVPLARQLPFPVIATCHDAPPLPFANSVESLDAPQSARPRGSLGDPRV